MAQPLILPEPAAPRLTTAHTSRRRRLADRLARWFVSAGGLAIIASILGILVFILLEVWPMLSNATVRPGATVPLSAVPIGAMIGDEHRTHVAVLGLDGRARGLRISDGAVVTERALIGPPTPDGEAQTRALTAVAALPGSHLLAGATADGRAVAVPVEFGVTFEVGTQRTVTPEIGDPVWFDLDPAARPLEAFSVRLAADGAAVAVAQLEDGALVAVRREVTENLLTGESSETTSRFTAALPYRLSQLLLDEQQTNLYGGTAGGELISIPLTASGFGDIQVSSAGSSPITALSLLVGDRALVVGQENGALSIWFQVRADEEGAFRLTRVRDFPRHPQAITLLAPSWRDKGFIAQDVSGRLGLYYSTSHRTLWRGASPLAGASALTYSPKGDGAYLAGDGRLAGLRIHNPHPEISWRAVFGRVWYEGYDRPDFVWQSTGGTDDFEPKLSLTPLLVGTLKGTFYALILAIPLGILGAMYASQFMHPNLLRYVKPTVEIMAALPTVVLGFLAGLWLAPRIERTFPGLLLMVVMLPLLVLLAGALWRSLPRGFRNRFPAGTESLFFILVLAGGVWLCLVLSAPVEAALFAGSFPDWLRETTGLTYDQRNAIVVGLAMGFAVIPIIFAISEDAFSNVPRNLTAGSLALGANRWQTVTRVVLPTASPGIFSAVMIGFGRAVGETMIVLMATGNTPIMSWSPFNGFRTLSANIAVEIPEAPHAGTLYRVLFLAALVLFVMTFIVNTLAEVIRQQLRRRYSEL